MGTHGKLPRHLNLGKQVGSRRTLLNYVPAFEKTNDSIEEQRRQRKAEREFREAKEKRDGDREERANRSKKGEWRDQQSGEYAQKGEKRGISLSP